LSRDTVTLREMQGKTIMRHGCTHAKRINIKKIKDNNICEDVKKRKLFTLLVGL
jgi:hypothetical protein